MNAVLNRRIDPDAPLPDATALLFQAGQIASQRIPAVPRSTSRAARKFNRAPIVSLSAQQQPRLGATSFFRHRTDARHAFTMTAPMAVPNARRDRMANAILMSGTTPRGRVPAVQPLDVLRARMMERRRARMVEGTLRHRFEMNSRDIADSKIDTLRMARARAVSPAPLAVLAFM